MQPSLAEIEHFQPRISLPIMRYHTQTIRVGLIRWPSDGSGIGEAIYHALEAQGHQPFYFSLGAAMTRPADVIFLFGPFGRFLHELGELRAALADPKPIFIFWNTEGLPDLRLPWPLMASLSAVRSWLGRLRNPVHLPTHTPSM